MTATASPAAPLSPVEQTGAFDAHAGQLAQIFQELLTAIVRLRAGRQVAADAESLRAHVRHMLGVASEEAQRAGYAPEDVRIAMFAVVAFLDESVLNSSAPIFADWPRKPLQDELFGGGHRGGELFYQYLAHLMERQDAAQLADLLEVFLLCLLLGFHGRYGASDDGERQLLTTRVMERVQRARGGPSTLPPTWWRSSGPIGALPPDPWIRRLLIAAGGIFGFALMLWLVFSLALGGGVDALAELGATAGAVAP